MNLQLSIYIASLCVVNFCNRKEAYRWKEKKEGTLVCKYCGRTGFFNVKSLSIHRRFSKSCLEAWKKEQEEIDNSKSKVKCAVCGEYLRNISNTHLRKHNMTQQEYKCKFPDAPIFSDGLLDLQKEKREATIVERYGDNNKIRVIIQDLLKTIHKYK